jgi:hypothetical protein
MAYSRPKYPTGKESRSVERKARILRIFPGRVHPARFFGMPMKHAG